MALTSLDWIVVAIYGAVGPRDRLRHGAARERQRGELLHRRPLTPLVAGGHLHRGDLVRQRRAPRHRRTGAPAGHLRELAVVVRGGRHPHADLLLRPTVAPRRGAHRRRGDRDPLRRRARPHPARLLRRLPGTDQERRGDGLGHAGDGEVQQRAPGMGPRAHPDRLRRAGAGLYRGVGALGGRGYRPDPVHRRHARRADPRRHRTEPLRRPRRHGRSHPERPTSPSRRPRPGADRSQRLLARDGVVPLPDRHPLAEKRTGRRLRGPAPVRDPGRAPGGEGVALVRLRRNGPPYMAVDRGRSRIAAGLPARGHGRRARRRPPSSPTP